MMVLSIKQSRQSSETASFFVPGKPMPDTLGYVSIMQSEVNAFSEIFAKSPEEYGAVYASYRSAVEDGYDGSMNYTTDMNGVAHFKVSGPIVRSADFYCYYLGGTAVDSLCAMLNRASNDPLVKGAFPVFQSPGGSIDGLDQAVAAMQNFRKKKPIVGFTDGLCASAAYWIGAQCDDMYGTGMSVLGSIGVYTVRTDNSKMLKNMGVDRMLFKSAPYKGNGESGVPMSEEGKAEIQREIDAFHAMFEKDVAYGRQMSPDKVSAVADGRGYIGKEAVDAGLMDGVMDKDSAYKKLVKRITDGKSPSKGKAMADEGLLDQIKALLGMHAKEEKPVVVTATTQLPAVYDVEKDPKYIAMASERDRLAGQERVRNQAIADQEKLRNDEVMEAYNKEGKFTPAKLAEETALRLKDPVLYDAIWKNRAVLPQFSTPSTQVPAKGSGRQDARTYTNRITRKEESDNSVAAVAQEAAMTVLRAQYGIPAKEDE
jgi:signal peptide peptidase SppA